MRVVLPAGFGGRGTAAHTIDGMTNDSCDLRYLDLPRAERLRGQRLSTVEADRAAAPARALGDPTLFAAVVPAVVAAR